MRELLRPLLFVAVSVAIAACSPPAQPSPKAAAPAGEQKGGATAKGNVSSGQQLFISQGCGACHAIQGVSGATGTVGPDLSQVAATAGQRVPGLSAEQYLRQSIQDPDAYTVAGFQKGVMPKLPLNDQQVNDLVAFLLTRQ